MMEQILYAKLSETGIKTYPIKVPIDTSYPVIRYQLITGMEENCLKGEKYRDKERYQVDVFASSYKEVKEKTVEVLSKLRELKTSQVTVRDGWEDDVDVYRQIIDFYLRS